jgi:hypothetical protein
LARLEDYIFLRRDGLSLRMAAERIGVVERTGWRYEKEYRELAA